MGSLAGPTEMSGNERNAGLRIDHLLLNPAVVDRMTDAGVYRNVRGWERPSDHAPVWVDLRD